MKKIKSFLVLCLLAATCFTAKAQNLNIIGMNNYLNTTLTRECNCPGQILVPTTVVSTLAQPLPPSGSLWIGPSSHMFAPAEQQQLVNMARQYANQYRPAGNCIIRYEFTLDILSTGTDWFIWFNVHYGRCQRYPTATPMLEKN